MVRGWHAEVGVEVGDSCNQRTGGDLPGLDRRAAAFEFADARLAEVESESGLSVASVAAVALQAVQREDRADIAIEVDSGVGGVCRGVGDRYGDQQCERQFESQGVQP